MSRVLRFHNLINYDSLLQNAIDIITKCDRTLLQNVSGLLLQNASVLLQNATVITNCDILLQNVTVITKCEE